MTARLLLVLWTAAIAWPAVALAHDGLRRSVPAKDAHLAVAPTSLRLTFTNSPSLSLVRVQLLSPANRVVALRELRLDSARTVVADILGPLVAGTHTVAWQIVGADGHPVRGRFTFTIAPGASGLGVSQLGHAAESATAADTTSQTHHDAVTMPGGPGFDVTSRGYVAIRWSHFMAVLAVIGAMAFALLVLPLAGRRGGERIGPVLSALRLRTATLGSAAAGMLLVTVFARLIAQSWALHGPAGAVEAGPLRGMLLDTTWGQAWVIHAASSFAALAGFLAARRGRAGAWNALALIAVALAFSVSLSAHAVSSGRYATLAVAADALHILGASGWLGGLLAVVTVGVPIALTAREGDRFAIVADIVNAFSPTALAFAALVAVTGVASAWLHLERVSALWQSDYGRALLWKLGFLGILMLTGAYNWLRVRPALGDARGAPRFRRTASIELAVAVAVIACTAVLVATPPPADVVRMNP